MSKYWMLTVQTPPGERRATIGRQPDLSKVFQAAFPSWTAGSLITETLPSPLEFELEPSSGDYVTDFFPPAIPLMTERMLAALAAAEVDNIQAFDAVLADRKGRPIPERFRAVNILGRIACADLEASECTVEDPEVPIGVDFESLVIDESRANDALFFRLHEAPNGIVVHELVKRTLDPLRLRGVVFVRPEDWSG